jgi:DUF4097 and DUF4098 domain-containing protein YvlB
MMTTLLAAALTVLSASTSTDTTITVGRGTRLALENFSGPVKVTTWARSAVRVRAEHGSRARVEVDVSEDAVNVEAEGRMGPPPYVEYAIVVPTWMDLELSGVGSDIEVEGSAARVSAESVQGDVRVSGGSGRVEVASVQGGVTVAGVRGAVEASSVNSAVSVEDVDGDVSAETVNGIVTLRRVRGTEVQASTVNGEIEWEGPLSAGGTYSFSTHAGPIRVCVPAPVDASVSVSTFSGDFTSDFDIVLSGRHKKERLQFVLGNGASRLELETFQGEITLCRLEGRSAK